MTYSKRGHGGVLGAEAHAVSPIVSVREKVETEGMDIPASSPSGRRTAKGWGLERELGRDDPSAVGVGPRVPQRPVEWNLLSRYTEPWPSCVSDLPKTSIKFRPIDTRAMGQMEYFVISL